MKASIASMSRRTLAKFAPWRALRLGGGEPAFNLIEPGDWGGNKVKTHLGMSFEPAVLFGLVSVEIVQDDVEFFVGVLGNQVIHEIQELTPTTAPIMSGMYQPATHVER